MHECYDPRLDPRVKIIKIVVIILTVILIMLSLAPIVLHIFSP